MKRHMSRKEKPRHISFPQVEGKKNDLPSRGHHIA